jgi:hypothetical protein
MGNFNKGEIDMAVLEEIRHTLKETKNQDLFYAVQELRQLGDEILGEHPDAFSDENLDEIIKQSRKIAKVL